MKYTFHQLVQEFILKECTAILAQTEAATGDFQVRKDVLRSFSKFTGKQLY